MDEAIEEAVDSAILFIATRSGTANALVAPGENIPFVCVRHSDIVAHILAQKRQYNQTGGTQRRSVTHT